MNYYLFKNNYYLLLINVVIYCPQQGGDIMTDYRKMYYTLCAATSTALDLLPENEETWQGRDVLQKALDEAEEIYITTDEEQDRP